tara:strand:+ start:918 stop:1523 length:606 start_codon:yes stop_codon:yes gene_type:complete
MARINKNRTKMTREERKKKVKGSKTTVSLPGGLEVNPKEQPDMYKLALGNYQMQRQNKVSTSDDWNEIATTLLNMLVDCTISGEKKNFSLIRDCGESEIIDNENILDREAYQNQPEPTSAEDKFPNVDDPFYQLGGDIPNDYDQKNTAAAQNNEPDVTCFAAAVTAKVLNIETTTSTTTAGTTETTTTTNNTQSTTTGTNY